MEKGHFENIQKQLAVLGFEDQLEEKLMLAACFPGSASTLVFSGSAGEDLFSFLVHLGNINSIPVVTDYLAVLRKPVPLDSVAEPLVKRIAKLDWKRIAAARSFSFADITATELQEIKEVLQLLDKHPDHARIKYSCWRGTNLESMIPGIAAFKNQYELSQRFYISPEHHSITSGEAMRFLQNRWLEKQVQQRRMEQRQAASDQRKKGSKRASKKKASGKS